MWLVASLIIDLDGLFYLLLKKDKSKEEKKIISLIKHYQYKRAATLLTISHKLFDKLLIHNILGYFIFVVLLIFSVKNYSEAGIIISGAVLTHFTFDFLDDFYQLGHINNWLWPIKKLPDLNF